VGILLLPEALGVQRRRLLSSSSTEEPPFTLSNQNHIIVVLSGCKFPFPRTSLSKLLTCVKQHHSQKHTVSRDGGSSFLEEEELPFTFINHINCDAIWP
jgi:hypothetical protein